jgi:hypothetical protein
MNAFIDPACFAFVLFVARKDIDAMVERRRNCAGE